VPLRSVHQASRGRTAFGVDDHGNLGWQRQATVWGAAAPTTAPAGEVADCPLRFPGQYQDAETGLHYNYFRYYDPATARYA
jgi:uncharacterized protein RhaS with RHS repeats